MKIVSKIVIALLLTFTLSLQLIMVGVTIFFHTLNGNTSQDITLIFGTISNPNDLDPQHAWDSTSYDLINQVCEGLYTYNLSDPNYAIIPNLATEHGSWSIDNKNYTFPLRQGVIFHDGTIFNATAVKWTFDRLEYLMKNGISQLEPVYTWTNGIYIINRTEVIDEYTIRFILNSPFSPLQALLCFSGSYILSPTSTNGTGLINLATGDLVGTGPFVYDLYTPNVKVRFRAFENYWAGSASIKNLTFSIINNPTHRNQALLNGTIDFLDDPLPNMLDTFETDPNITLVSTQDLIIRYLGMNNKQINKTVRQAISFAINYSYIISEIIGGQSVRLKSPIPEGILYANWSFNVATYNVTKARQNLLDKGVVSGLDLYTDSDWTDLVDFGTPIATYNYTYNTGNVIRENFGYLLQDNLRQIGINVTFAGINWTDFLYRLYEVSGYTRDMIQLYFSGWVPDYNDPSQFINNLMTNRTVASNGAQINDSYVQDLMEEGLRETDPTIRKGIYEEIQRYCVEDLMPWAFCYVPFNYDAYSNDFIGYQPNAMGKKWFYSMSRKLPEIAISPIVITYGSIGAIGGILGSSIVVNRIKKLKINTELKRTKKLLKELKVGKKDIEAEMVKKELEEFDIIEKKINEFKKVEKESKELRKVEKKEPGRFQKELEKISQDLVEELENKWYEFSKKFIKKIKNIIIKYKRLKSEDEKAMLENFQQLAKKYLSACKKCRKGNFDEGLSWLQKIDLSCKKFQEEFEEEMFENLAKEAQVSYSDFMKKRDIFQGGGENAR